MDWKRSAMMVSVGGLTIAVCSVAARPALAADAEEVELPDEPTVELIEAGQEPHETLRHAPEQGHVEHVQVGMDVAMSFGEQFEFEMPHTSVALELRYEGEPDDDEPGEYVLAYEYLSVEIESEGGQQSPMVEMMQDQADALGQVTGRLVIDGTGRIYAHEVEGADALSGPVQPQVERIQVALEQALLPYPQDGVGIGGQWEQVRTVDTTGLAYRQTRQLTRAEPEEGEEIRVSSEQEQVAPDQEIEQMGGTSPVADFTGSGSSTLALSSDRLLGLGEIEMENSYTTEGFGPNSGDTQVSTEATYTLTAYEPEED